MSNKVECSANPHLTIIDIPQLTTFVYLSGYLNEQSANKTLNNNDNNKTSNKAQNPNKNKQTISKQNTLFYTLSIIC